MGKQEISNTNNVEKWSSQAFFFSFFLFYFLGVEVRVREERSVFKGAGRGGMECPYQGPCKTFLQIDIYSWCSLMKVNYWKIFYLFCHMYSSVVQKLICKKHSPESSTKAISYCDATIYVQWCRVISCGPLLLCIIPVSSTFNSWKMTSILLHCMYCVVGSIITLYLGFSCCFLIHCFVQKFTQYILLCCHSTYGVFVLIARSNSF